MGVFSRSLFLAYVCSSWDWPYTTSYLLWQASLSQARQGETATWATLRVKDLSDGEWERKHQLGQVTCFWLRSVARFGTGTSIWSSLLFGAFKVFRNLALYHISPPLPPKTFIVTSLLNAPHPHNVSPLWPCWWMWGSRALHYKHPLVFSVLFVL